MAFKGVGVVAAFSFHAELTFAAFLFGAGTSGFRDAFGHKGIPSIIGRGECLLCAEPCAVVFITNLSFYAGVFAASKGRICFVGISFRFDIVVGIGCNII